MSLLGRIVRPRSEQTDWLFIGFIGLVVLSSTFVGGQKVRYRRATAAFATCAADADATCAASPLEKLRSIDAENVRTRIAEAEMRALLGDADVATSMLARALQGVLPSFAAEVAR